MWFRKFDRFLVSLLYNINTTAAALGYLDIVKVDADIVFPAISFHRQIDGRLVDSRVFGELAVLLQVPRLIRIVTVDYVDLIQQKPYKIDNYVVT